MLGKPLWRLYLVRSEPVRFRSRELDGATIGVRVDKGLWYIRCVDCADQRDERMPPLPPKAVGIAGGLKLPSRRPRDWKMRSRKGFCASSHSVGIFESLSRGH